ncbi:TonB-dependent receptor domain-containing protein [Mucilaginibacter sp. UC70_90]
MNKTVKSLSYSAALNYKFSEEQALYIRYSEGRKAPDLQSVTAVSSQAQADAVSFIPIHVVQAELGYKVQKGGFTGYFTPFYSDISNKPSFDYTQDVQVNTYYYTKAVFSEQRTIGVEMESVFNIGNHINVRGAVTLQHATSVVERHWNVGQPGPADDQVVETRGRKSRPNTCRTDKYHTFLPVKQIYDFFGMEVCWLIGCKCGRCIYAARV